jgi:hypothetical protein
VPFDGLDRDEEGLRDLFVRVPVGREFDDMLLARRQLALAPRAARPDARELRAGAFSPAGRPDFVEGVGRQLE